MSFSWKILQNSDIARETYTLHSYSGRIYDICIKKFGFMSNPAITDKRNFENALLQDNFDPTKLAAAPYPANSRVHNLCDEDTPLPPLLLKSLGLGLGFGLSLQRKHETANIDFERLKRDIRIKYYMADKRNDDDNDTYNPKLYVRNDEWDPDPAPDDVENAIDRFRTKVDDLYAESTRERHKYNLSPQAVNELRTVKRDGTISVSHTDKNLGPAVIETNRMIKKAQDDHLNDTSTYQEITKKQADEQNESNYRYICKLMIDAKDVDDATKKFFRRRLNGQRNSDGRMQHKQELQLPYLYVTYKVHKSPLKTRPVVSQTNSVLEPLSQWLDDQLQQVLHHCPAYLKDSWQLLRDIKQLPKLPPTASIYTADAKAMYTNINVDHGLHTIDSWFKLHNNDIPVNFPITKVMDGLNLIMRNNVFHFGNRYFKQINGTAMGTSVACAYATLYYSYHEETQLLNSDKHSIFFYRRLIDDALIIQDTTPGKHTCFAYDMNNFGPHGKRLEWEYLQPSDQVDFLDFTLILEDGHIQTKTYQKPMNLYLYRPPNSAQPPSILYGLIYGTMHRLYWQNSKTEWFCHYLQLFYQRLIDRGHDSSTLAPLFLKAAQRVEQSSIPKARPYGSRRSNLDSTQCIYLHAPYHPQNPARSAIQEAFKSTLLPAFLDNPEPNLNRMVIAYSRAPNIADTVKRNRLKPTVDTTQVSGPTNMDNTR